VKRREEKNLSSTGEDDEDKKTAFKEQKP